MILNIGLDIVEKKRIKKIYLKYKSKFLSRILHIAEFNLIANKRNKLEFISRIFAVKEAFLKAFGSGIRSGISFKKINVVNSYLGKPELAKLNKIKFLLTIAHERVLTIAIVVVIKF